jgi:3-hydroxyisobutyrate dehydrogenase-like beta-hydroxyacid dehydrogenase
VDQGATVTVVGVLGVGEIGRGLMKALEPTGFRIAICDARPEAMQPYEHRAVLCTDAKSLGALADVVLVAVVDDEQVLNVLEGPDGALESLHPNSTVLVISTVSINTLRRVAAKAAEVGVGLLDCGISGGPAAAAQGQWVSMVGGSDEDFTRARAVLDAFSSLVVRMGPLGAGMRSKLARQVVQFGSWLAAYEGQRLAEAADVDLAKFAQVIRESDAKIGGATALMFRSTVAPFGADDDPGLIEAMRNGARLAHKDLAAARALAAELALDVPLVDLANEQMDRVFGIAP